MDLAGLYQIAFSLLQVVMLFALGWFIRLLFKFSGDLRRHENKNGDEHKKLENRIHDVELKQAVDEERQKNLRSDISEIKVTLGRIFARIDKANDK